MDYEERRKLEELKAQQQKDKAFELQYMRDQSKQTSERAKLEAKLHQLNTQNQQAMDLENMKHHLQPEQLDNLFFDYERRHRVDHFYNEQKEDAELDRQKERMSHAMECELIKEKFLLKLRQKYADKQISDDELKSMLDGIMSDD